MDKWGVLRGSKQIRNEIDRAIGLWVPRVSVEDVSFPQVVDDKFVRVTISYTIPNQNVQDELTLEVT